MDTNTWIAVAAVVLINAIVNVLVFLYYRRIWRQLDEMMRDVRVESAERE